MGLSAATAKASSRHTHTHTQGPAAVSQGAPKAQGQVKTIFTKCRGTKVKAKTQTSKNTGKGNQSEGTIKREGNRPKSEIPHLRTGNSCSLRLLRLTHLRAKWRIVHTMTCIDFNTAEAAGFNETPGCYLEATRGLVECE